MDVLGRAPGHIVAAEDRLPIVTEWSGMGDWVNCPPDYETWARQYVGYTRFYLAKYCNPMWVEDVVQEIMSRFQERDSLGVFSRSWETRSKSGKSNFRSYYIRFLVEYAPGKNRNYFKRYSREQLIADAPVGDDGSTTWLEMHSESSTDPRTPDPTDSAAFAELAAQLRSAVASPLTPVIDALVNAAMAGSDLPTADLAQVLGCTQTTASSRLRAVRSQISSSPLSALSALAG